MLSQSDGLGIWGNWISHIQEYDLEIKPIKIVKGKGLAELLTEKEVLVNCVEKIMITQISNRNGTRTSYII